MAYQAAVKASPQREVQLLCLHEVGWCHLILLHWSHAHVSFLRLKKESRWSKGFYAYLAAGSPAVFFYYYLIYIYLVFYGAWWFNVWNLMSNLIVCRGAAGDERGAIQLSSEAPKLATNRQTQLEVFIARRTVQLGPHSYTTTGCKLLAFELLFLWNALPSCSAQQLRQIIQGKWRYYHISL